MLKTIPAVSSIASVMGFECEKEGEGKAIG